MQWQQSQMLQLQQQSVLLQQHQQPTPSQVDAAPSKKKKAGKNKGKATQQPTPTDQESSTSKKRAWPQIDEEALGMAWFHVSQDSVVGNNQQNGVFWKRVEDHYNQSNPKVPRIYSLLSNHWGLVKPKITKFNGFYLSIKSRYHSGWSEEQYVDAAKEEYVNDPANKNGLAFKYEHIWKKVRGHQIFSSCTSVHGNQHSKRSKTNSSGGYTASSASNANFGEDEFHINLDDDEPIQEEQVTPESRPMGRDRAKAKAKAERGKGSSSSSTVEEHKLTMLTNMSNAAMQKQQVLKTFEDSIKSITQVEQTFNHGATPQFLTSIERFRSLRSATEHTELQNDLIQHLWANKSVHDDED
ncbi:hypothetical protein E3N88_10010 [Mikania micrantha]|uniref:No apical meristem-associated C-terminal domain-containing protein n=1 Tax=Mikania micrantha TaxID=192012 RepID=A0A5N6PAL0_9ASTR|nr:hypothetical protein E3N88_10010 [Mikania micrantha]